MPTKQQIRKYVHEIKACNRIKVFITPSHEIYWFHFINRKGKIVGFCNESVVTPATFREQVIRAKKFATRIGKCIADAGDPVLAVLKRYHEKNYIRGITIVRKNGVWGFDA